MTNFKDYIGMKDIKLWDGITRTFQRITSTGGWLTSNKFGESVNVLEVYGSGSAYTDATLNAAISRIGSNVCEIVLTPGTWTISNNVTIPANISLRLPKGAILSKSSGSLTINGPFPNGPYQVFSGFSAGDVTGLKEVYPEWWGAKGDDSTDDLSALTRAFKAGEGGKIKLIAKYRASAAILIYKKTILEGLGRQSTGITWTHTGDGIQSTWPINSSTGVWITGRDCYLKNNNGGNTGGGFVDVGGSFVDLFNVYISGFKYEVIFDQTEVATIKQCELVTSTGAIAGVWLVNGADHTVGADKLYTNRITISETQFNSAATVPYNIIDDGGGAHSFINNNFNSAQHAIRICNVFALNIEGNESEAHSDYDINFFDTTYANAVTYVGRSSAINISANILSSDSCGSNIFLDYADNVNIFANYFGQAVTAAVTLKNTTTNTATGIKVFGNYKHIIGTYRTASPFIAGSTTPIARIDSTEQNAATYSASSIASGTRVVTPATMEFITPGSKLMCQNDDGTNAEEVLVTATTASTFTATFATAKSAYFLINSSVKIVSGTWIPVLYGGTTAGTQTYTTQTGNWSREGNTIFAQCHIVLATLDGATAGSLRISGLPYAPAARMNIQNGIMGLYQGVTLAAGYQTIVPVISSGYTYIELWKTGTTKSASSLTPAELSGTALISFTLVYQIN